MLQALFDFIIVLLSSTLSLLVVSDLFPSADCVAIVVSDSINTVGEVELTARARWQLWLDASAGQILCLIFNIYLQNVTCIVVDPIIYLIVTDVNV